MKKQIFFLILITFCSCNFWDNMFSNLKGPNLEIPKEFKLQLNNLLNKKFPGKPV